MDDLVKLLERTTPAVSAPDVRRLTRRARARLVRRLACIGVPLVALAAGAVAMRPATQDRVSTASGTRVIGTWRRTSPPPIDLTSQVRTATLSDGRIVVVAGSFDVDNQVRPFETAVYDANSDRWSRLATAPVTPRAGGADLLVAPDRIMLVTHDDGNDVGVAMLDGHSLKWRAMDIPAQLGHVFDGWAFDGTTLVLVRSRDNSYGDPTGTPMVARWNANTQTWRHGASPPLVSRFLPTVARSDRRLAMWGGYTFDANALGSVPMPKAPLTPTSVGSRNDPPRRALTDGAIYDIGRDSWTYLPPESSLTEMATRSAEGLVNEAAFTLIASQIEGVPRIVARYEHGGWRRLPSPSAAGGMYAVEQETGTISVASANESGPQPAQYIDSSATQWRAAPAYDLAQSSRGLLAISATTDNPANAPFSVWQLDGTSWAPATPAPFENRMEPGLGVTGDRLLVIGGQQGPNLEQQHDAWLLDLTPTR